MSKSRFKNFTSAQLKELILSESSLRGVPKVHIEKHDNCSITTKVFEKVRVTEEVYLLEVDKIGRIEFKNCSFENDFVIGGNTNIYEICFTGQTTFKKDIKVTDSADIANLTFEGNCKMERAIRIDKSAKLAFLTISDEVYVQQLEISSHAEITYQLTIQGKADVFWFTSNGNSVIKFLEIKENTKIGILNLRDFTKYEDFLITGSVKLHNVNFNGGTCLKGFKITGDVENGLPQIRMLNFKGVLSNDIFINSARVFNLTFSSFINRNLLRIINVSNQDEPINVNIQSSSLGNTEIIGSDWKKGKLTVDNSRIIDVFYTDSIFPDDIDSTEDDPQEKNKQIRDTFSQLKTIADKQNDRSSSLNFQAKANEYIYRIKKDEITWWNTFDPEWWEWAQLALSKYSNDFGTSYRRALGCILLSGAILFCLYLPFTNSNFPSVIELWCFPSLIWNMIDHHIGNFLGFLNPTRSIGYMCKDGDCNNQWALVIDWFSRLIIAYLLYQFVQAFRKYGKA